MDPATVAAYERSAAEYAARRSAYGADRAEAFAGSLGAGRLRLDLGCGPGLYLGHLGRPLVAADAAQAMVRTAVAAHPDVAGVRGDLTALPFRSDGLAGVWASKAHQHVPAAALPGALGEIQRVLPVGGRLELTMFGHDGSGDTETRITGADDDFPDRLFTLWHADALRDVLVGAGFDVDALTVAPGDWPRLEVRAVRARSLADTVGPDMRLLVCGLNPSVYSADAGVGYARPGNRFWPALRLAGLTDPRPRRTRAAAPRRHRHDRPREAGDGGRGGADAPTSTARASTGSTGCAGCSRPARSASSGWPAGVPRSTVAPPSAGRSDVSATPPRPT